MKCTCEFLLGIFFFFIERERQQTNCFVISQSFKTNDSATKKLSHSLLITFLPSHIDRQNTYALCFHQSINYIFPIFFFEAFPPVNVIGTRLGVGVTPCWLVKGQPSLRSYPILFTSWHPIWNDETSHKKRPFVHFRCAFTCQPAHCHVTPSPADV